MATFDTHKNLAVSLVATAPSPASSGTSLVVTAGQGGRFPATPFNATIWANGALPDPTNAEIVRVTNVTTDTLTITRAQEGTSARTVLAGDSIAATITAKTLTDVETAIPSPLPQSYLRTATHMSNIDIVQANVDSAVSIATGNGTFTFFTAPISITTTSITYYVSTAAASSAAGTEVAIYSVDASDNLTKIAGKASTTLFTSTGIITQTWTASTSLTAGSRYAVGMLHIAGSGTPVLLGQQYGANGALLRNVVPKLSGFVSSLGSLAASQSAASFNTANGQQNIFYCEVF